MVNIEETTIEDYSLAIGRLKAEVSQLEATFFQKKQLLKKMVYKNISDQYNKIRVSFFKQDEHES